MPSSFIAPKLIQCDAARTSLLASLLRQAWENGSLRITLHTSSLPHFLTSWLVTGFRAAHSHIQRPLSNTTCRWSSHCLIENNILDHGFDWLFDYLSKSIPFWATSATSKVASLNLSQSLLSRSQYHLGYSATDRCRCRCSKSEITARLSTNVGRSHGSSHRSHGSSHGGLRIWIMATFATWSGYIKYFEIFGIWYDDAMMPWCHTSKIWSHTNVTKVLFKDSRGFNGSTPFPDMFSVVHFEAFTAAPIPKSPPASTNLDGNWWEARSGKPMSKSCCDHIWPCTCLVRKETMLIDWELSELSSIIVSQLVLTSGWLSSRLYWHCKSGSRRHSHRHNRHSPHSHRNRLTFGVSERKAQGKAPKVVSENSLRATYICWVTKDFREIPQRFWD